MGRLSSVTLVASVALVVTVASTAGAAALASPGGTDGTVTDTQELVTLTVTVQTNTGDALGGATVRVRYDGGSNTTQTFSNGRALVDVPRGVDATVNVTDETYVINRPLTAESVDGETTVEVIMYPKATAVVEVEDDSGVVRDAQVTLRKDGANEPLSPGVTGPNGVYQRSNVEAGTYTATVVKRGYRRTQAEVQVTPPSSGVTVSLEEATVPLTIQVFDDHFRTEQPLADAEVTVLAGGEQVRQGPTGDNGRVQFSAGVNGLYVIRVTKAGYTTAEREIPLGESGADYEFRIQRTPTLSVNTGADSVIAGESVLVQVRNAYNEPVESVLVRRNGTNVGTTDGNGELRVSIPEVGRYEIVATDDGVSSEPAVVQGFQPATPTTEATPTATATATATPEPTTTESAPLPGFGPLVGLLAVVLAVVLVRRRR